MASADRRVERPPLKSSDIYRPRLGSQKPPLSRTTMAEIRAWREASAQAEGAAQRKQTG